MSTIIPKKPPSDLEYTNAVAEAQIQQVRNKYNLMIQTYSIQKSASTEPVTAQLSDANFTHINS